MTKILAIETSCDETGISIIESKDDKSLTVLSDNLISQIDIHKQYGGVYPTEAKRAHATNITPLLAKTLSDANLFNQEQQNKLSDDQKVEIKEILQREPELANTLIELLDTLNVPDIDAIAVTNGPGLAPALWIGVNVAAILALVWKKPLVPVNHMEGHIYSALLKSKDKTNYTIEQVVTPAIALLISGGHTEIILFEKMHKYKLLGGTRDDAVGEAFDKVARLLDLEYPGGPKISALAEKAREKNLPKEFELPRPMLHSKDFDFSFSGLKTAVLMITKRNNPLSTNQKQQISKEFEDAAAEVFSKKILLAIEQTNAKSIIIGGGVSANSHINSKIQETISSANANISIYTPQEHLTGDNALMIAVAGYFNFKNKQTIEPKQITADSNLSLS